MKNTDSLTGKVLIAMPGMSDPRFARSVVLICAHGDEGAMGLVVNRPLEGLDFTDLLKQLEIDATPQARRVAVRFGGPVEPGRGFVLHRANDADDIDEGEGRMRIGESDLAMTTTRDILEDLARGQGPDAAVLSLGYAGWGAGQLDEEMTRHGWLTAKADPAVLFDTAADARWNAALRTNGIDPRLLSSTSGTA